MFLLSVSGMGYSICCSVVSLQVLSAKVLYYHIQNTSIDVRYFDSVL